MKPIKLVLILIVLLTSSVLGQKVSVDEPAVCYQCHADIEENASMKNVHTAFEGGICSECHNPHASKHAALLDETPLQLCASCHDSFEGVENNSKAHQPVKSGECLSCHDPHASNNNNQLKLNETELCKSCHNEITGWMNSTVVHAPVADNECSNCHNSHMSENGKLLTTKVPELCFECHSADQAFNAAHKGSDDMSQADCTTCHDPHASSNKNLIMSNQHKPFASGNCKSCHLTTGTTLSFKVKDDPKDLCLKCHRTIDKDKDVKFRHVMDDDNSCLNCHNPHASKGSGLLVSAQQQTVCTNCHFSDDTKHKKEFYLTHTELECTTCHDPHSSNEDKYLIEKNLDLCNTCHAEAHKASHPVGEGIIDPRKGEQVTCLSCHKLHGANFPDYLPLDPKMDLCIQCHDK